MEDIVVGSVSGYEWPDVALWANSLKRSGFTGKKALVVYEGSLEFIGKAQAEGFEVVFDEIKPPDTVYWKRYHGIWSNADLLKLNDYRYVIHTDVRDVVFQKNPSDWLAKAYIGYNQWQPIIAATEAVKHKDDWWNAECMRQSFGPDCYETTKDNIVYCSGVIAGNWSALGPLFHQVYLISKASPVSNCDQSAYNILAHSTPFRELVYAPELARGWCLNCSIALHPEKSKFMVEEASVSHHDGLVVNGGGIPFAILHQYDRLESLKERVTKRYA